MEYKSVTERKSPERPRRSLMSTLGNAIDRLVLMVNPIAGAKRIATRRMLDAAENRLSFYGGGPHWYGAKKDPAKDHRWMTSQLSTDTGQEQDLAELRQRAEALYRHNSYAHAAVDARTANEVGEGITPKSRIRGGDDRPISEEEAKRLNDEFEDVYERFNMAGVDRRRQHSMESYQQFVVRSFANAGEAFVLLSDASSVDSPIPLVFDWISPDRVETPPEHAGNPLVRLGIEYEADGPGGDRGSIKGYYVRDSRPGDRLDHQQTYTFYERKTADGHLRMLHIFDPMDPDQTRGLPWLVATMHRLLGIEDWFEAELACKQVEACFGVIMRGGPTSPAPFDQAEGNASGDVDSRDNRLEDLYPGMVHYQNSDDGVDVIDPNRPGANFAPFIEKALRSVAGAANMPYELLSKDFFRTTFASGRLAMMDGKLGFKMRQKVLIQKFLWPVWRRMVFEAVVTGAADMGSDGATLYAAAPALFERHRWSSRSFTFIEPEKQARANAINLENGVTTLEEIHSQEGLWTDEQTEIRSNELEKEVRRDVKLRQLRFDLETEAGIPHFEEMPEQAQDDITDKRERVKVG